MSDGVAPAAAGMVPGAVLGPVVTAGIVGAPSVCARHGSVDARWRGAEDHSRKKLIIMNELQPGDLQGYDDADWVNFSIGVCSYRFYFATTCVKMNVPHHSVGGDVLRRENFAWCFSSGVLVV